MASLKRRNFRTPPGSGQGRWRIRTVVFDEQQLRGRRGLQVALCDVATAAAPNDRSAQQPERGRAVSGPSATLTKTDKAAIILPGVTSSLGEVPAPLRWSRNLRQVAMRESCFYKRLRNRSSQ